MHSRMARSALVIISGLALIAGVGSSAQAKKPVAQPSEQKVVIAAEGVAQRDGRVFYRTGPIDDQTLVVVPDAAGELPGGLPADEGRAILAAEGPDALAAAMSASGGEVTTLASHQSTWSAFLCCTWAQYQSLDVLWGWDSTATVQYSWAIQPGTSQWACSQGWGHYTGYNGSDYGVWGKWYPTGCLKANAAGLPKYTTVPWGNVIGNPKMKFQSQHSFAGANGTWGW